MTIISPIIPISDLRQQAKEILEQVKTETVVLTQRGRAVAVVVDFDTYNQMTRRLQALEEFRDEATLLIAQANLGRMTFAGVDALAMMYQEKVNEPLPTH